LQNKNANNEERIEKTKDTKGDQISSDNMVSDKVEQTITEVSDKNESKDRLNSFKMGKRTESEGDLMGKFKRF